MKNLRKAAITSKPSRGNFILVRASLKGSKAKTTSLCRFYNILCIIISSNPGWACIESVEENGFRSDRQSGCWWCLDERACERRCRCTLTGTWVRWYINTHLTTYSFPYLTQWTNLFPIPSFHCDYCHTNLNRKRTIGLEEALDAILHHF